MVVPWGKKPVKKGPPQSICSQRFQSPTGSQESITRIPPDSRRGDERYSDVDTQQFKEKTMFTRLLPTVLAMALACAGPAGASEVARQGDVEVHSVAVPTIELTPEAARDFNITPSTERGLLTVTLIKKGRGGKAESVAGQVYAGGFTMDNKLFTIPIREVRQPDGVYYLGEYRINAPDMIRFLVNANVLGKSMKVEFSRAFNVPQALAN
jgi:hypothetical protein